MESKNIQKQIDNIQSKMNMNRDDLEDIEQSIVEYQSLMSEYILNREQYPFDNNMTQ